MPICPYCDKQAVFNYPGNKTGVYCGTHKHNGMVHIRMKICNESECVKGATCNYPTEMYRPIKCTTHKLEGMVDVNHKHCELCYNVASQKFPDDKSPSRCKIHALPGMVGGDSRKCLECTKGATFGYPDTTKRLYCRLHTKEGMVDLVSQKCLTDGCNTQVYCHSNNDYCYDCYHRLFPNAPVTRNHNTKEKRVVRDLNLNFLNAIVKRWVTDTTIPGGTSLRRPDMLGIYDNHYIIIDVDERQHKFYDKDNDNRRNEEIKNDLAGKPLIHIRFNPDCYRNAAGRMINGPWRKNDNILELENEAEWTMRLCVLKMVLSVYVFSPPTKSQEIALFFDGFDDDLGYILAPHDRVPDALKHLSAEGYVLQYKK